MYSVHISDFGKVYALSQGFAATFVFFASLFMDLFILFRSQMSTFEVGDEDLDVICPK